MGYDMSFCYPLSTPRHDTIHSPLGYDTTGVVGNFYRISDSRIHSKLRLGMARGRVVATHVGSCF